MGTVLKLYATTAVVFFAIDLIWIGVVAQGFYQRTLSHLLAEEVRWGAALLFYAIYVGGLVGFALVPALEAQSLGRALVMGGLLGLFAYATFDLTALALFRDFPVRVAVIDMIWGTALSASVTGIAFAIGRQYG